MTIRLQWEAIPPRFGITPWYRRRPILLMAHHRWILVVWPFSYWWSYK